MDSAKMFIVFYREKDETQVAIFDSEDKAAEGTAALEARGCQYLRDLYFEIQDPRAQEEFRAVLEKNPGLEGEGILAMCLIAGFETGRGYEASREQARRSDYSRWDVIEED